MKINDFVFEQIESKSEWERFLLENNNLKFSFIQSLQWMEFQKSVGRDSFCYKILNSKNEIVGLFNCVVILARRGRYLYIRNGPIIDWNDLNLADSTISFLKNLAKSKGLWFIRISPLVMSQSTEAKTIGKLNLIDCPMNDVEALDTYVFNIDNKTEEEIFAEIQKKTRYEIRKAMDLCEVIVTKDIKAIDDFYIIEEDTVKRNNWIPYSKDYILNEFKSFVQDGLADVVLVKYEGKYIAGGIFIHFLEESYYHYGASLTEYRNIPASYLMIWEAIKLSKKRGSKRFNFWGITPENAKSTHPWVGLTKFKMKFPGDIVRWNTSKDIPVSKKYYLTNFFERYDRHKKGY